ncbi:MAG: hypothetical protein EXR95_03160 [Gemmatimonadetes bacterium]|nr:hypothetical protein [Gemmatimonadota bacterium]
MLHVAAVGEHPAQIPFTLREQGLRDQPRELDALWIGDGVEDLDRSPVAEEDPLGVHGDVVHESPGLE